MKRVYLALLSPLLLQSACSDESKIASDDAGVTPLPDATVDADIPADGGDVDHFERDAAFDRAAPLLPCAADAGSAGRIKVRLLAGNITSGNKQSYDDGPGIRIFQTLQPDVAMIQEFNYKTNADTEIAEFVSTAFGPTFAYARGSGQLANGVISRFPILEHGDWLDPRVSNRTFVWARIDIPGPKDLWAVSVHLLTTNSSERRIEGDAIVAEIQRKVPVGDYIAIGGDYNTDNRTESVLLGLSSVVSIASPFPMDRTGNDNTSANRTKPYDMVLANDDLRVRETAVVLKTQSFLTGLVFDTRTYVPLAELMPPLLGAESTATFMQHMPVVRDFVAVCGQ